MATGKQRKKYVAAGARAPVVLPAACPVPEALRSRLGEQTPIPPGALSQLRKLHADLIQAKSSSVQAKLLAGLPSKSVAALAKGLQPGDQGSFVELQAWLVYLCMLAVSVNSKPLQRQALRTVASCFKGGSESGPALAAEAALAVWASWLLQQAVAVVGPLHLQALKGGDALAAAATAAALAEGAGAADAALEDDDADDLTFGRPEPTPAAAGAGGADDGATRAGYAPIGQSAAPAEAEAEKLPALGWPTSPSLSGVHEVFITLPQARRALMQVAAPEKDDCDGLAYLALWPAQLLLACMAKLGAEPAPSESLADAWGACLAGSGADQPLGVPAAAVAAEAVPSSTAHFPTVAQEAAAASRLLEGLCETLLQLPDDHAALGGVESALARAIRRGVGCAALVLGHKRLSPTLRAVADGGGAMLQDTLSSFARAVTVALAAHARVSQHGAAARSSALLAWAKSEAVGLPSLPRLSVTPALAAAAQSASVDATTSASMVEAASCGPAIAAVATADAADAALVAFALKQLRVWADWGARSDAPGEDLRRAAMKSVAQAAGWLGHQDKRVQGFARDAFGALLKLAMAAGGSQNAGQAEGGSQQWDELLQSCVCGHATGASLWPIVAAMLSAAPPPPAPATTLAPAALNGWRASLRTPAATVLRTVPDIVAALCGGGHLAAESTPAAGSQQAVNVEGGATTARARRDATVLVLELLRMLRTELAGAAGLDVGPRGVLQRPGDVADAAGSKETSKSRRRRRAREHAEAARQRLEADPAAHHADDDAAVEEAATAVETAWAQVWVPAVAALLAGTSPAATTWEVSRVSVQSLVKPLLAGGGSLTKVAVRMLVDTLVNPTDRVDAGRLGEGDDHLPADPMDRGQAGRRLWAAVAVLRVARSAGLVAVADLFGSQRPSAHGVRGEPAAAPPSLPAAAAAPTRPRRRRFTQQSPRLAAAISSLKAARQGDLAAPAAADPLAAASDPTAAAATTTSKAADFAALLRRAISHPAVPVRKEALALLAHAGPRAPPLSVREAQLLSRCAAAWTSEGAGSKERLSALLQPALLRARDSARATIKRVRWLRQLGLAIVEALGGQEVEAAAGGELPATWAALAGTRVEVLTVASGADANDDANESSDPVLRPGGPMHAAVAADALPEAAEEPAAASIELSLAMLADCWRLGVEQAALDRLGDSPSLHRVAAALPARSAILHLFTVGWLADDMACAAVACIEPGSPGLRASAGCELGLALMQVFGWGVMCPCDHATDPRVGAAWSLPAFPEPFLRPLGALASATAQWRLVTALRAGTGAIRRLAERWLLQLPFSAATDAQGGPTTQQLAHLALWLTRSPRSAEAESGSHLLRVLGARWPERKLALAGASLLGVEAAVTEAVRVSLDDAGAQAEAKAAAAAASAAAAAGSSGLLSEVVGVARCRVEAMRGALAAGLGDAAVAAAEQTAASAFADEAAAAGPAGIAARGAPAAITPSLAAAGRTLLASGGSALPHGSLLAVRRAIELAGRGDLRPRAVLRPLLLAFRLSLLVVGGADDAAPQPSEGGGNEVLLGPELTSWARQTGE